MKNKPDNQETYKPKRDAKGRILPGFTGNPKGRPKGSTLKEYQAQKFREMSDEEKEIRQSKRSSRTFRTYRRSKSSNRGREESSQSIS